MNKMTIEIKNGVFTRQWTKGVNTKIFKDYKILDYIENFDNKFDTIFDVIDLPNLTLFEIIENIKSLTFSIITG